VKLAREKGIKAGLLRPITLFPFPSDKIAELTRQLKGILTVELSAGQMIEDVKLAAEGRVKVALHNRMGGMVPSPEEVLDALIKHFSI
jgi:2-oxoglutarate ferredoxin oxidoreductase subunit alpha